MSISSAARASLLSESIKRNFDMFELMLENLNSSTNDEDIRIAASGVSAHIRRVYEKINSFLEFYPSHYIMIQSMDESINKRKKKNIELLADQVEQLELSANPANLPLDAGNNQEEINEFYHSMERFNKLLVFIKRNHLPPFTN